jgi:hypothetical protein
MARYTRINCRRQRYVCNQPGIWLLVKEDLHIKYLSMPDRATQHGILYDGKTRLIAVVANVVFFSYSDVLV